MNISAWTIYWFIKLDAIISIMGGLGAVSITVCVVIVTVIMILCLNKETMSTSYRTLEAVEAEKEKWTQYIKYWTKLFKRVIILPFIFLILSNMIPTTKEMAVIYVIPKIANSTFVNETLPAEMKDIYGLAKQWMKDTVGEKAKDVVKETTKVEEGA